MSTFIITVVEVFIVGIYVFFYLEKLEPEVNPRLISVAQMHALLMWSCRRGGNPSTALLVTF